MARHQVARVAKEFVRFERCSCVGSVPLLCPACQTFVRHDWTDACGVCHASLFDAPAEAEGPEADDLSARGPIGGPLTFVGFGVALGIVAVLGVLAFQEQTPHTSTTPSRVADAADLADLAAPTPTFPAKTTATLSQR